MESLRDVRRVMEREAKKGSCPLMFDRLEFGGKPFQSITSEEKLDEALAYANVLKAAMKMYLNHRKQKAQRTHGKTSVKKLIGEGVGHRPSKSRTATSSHLSVWQKSIMLILP